MSDKLIKGWQAIADFFEVDRSTMLRRRIELMEAGVVFYKWTDRPRRRIVCAFPSILKIWITKKSSKGEML